MVRKIRPPPYMVSKLATDEPGTIAPGVLLAIFPVTTPFQDPRGGAGGIIYDLAFQLPPTHANSPFAPGSARGVH